MCQTQSIFYLFTFFFLDLISKNVLVTVLMLHKLCLLGIGSNRPINWGLIFPREKSIRPVFMLCLRDPRDQYWKVPNGHRTHIHVTPVIGQHHVTTYSSRTWFPTRSVSTKHSGRLYLHLKNEVWLLMGFRQAGCLSRSFSAQEKVMQGLIGIKFRLSTVEENKCFVACSQNNVEP